LRETSTTLNHPTPLQASVVALDIDYAGVNLVLHQKCRIQKIEGPNGEVTDRETFELEHLKKPSGPQAALLTPSVPEPSRLAPAVFYGLP
jgi:hypothetical protein